MIRLTDDLWIGDSGDGFNARALNVDAVLNVARDLRGMVGHPTIEYAQVGLVDGPGNTHAAYCAAVLTLASLIERYEVMVYCHTGSRSMAVALMYLNATARRGWDGWMELLGERVDIPLPVPHEAHRAAFDKINWRVLAKLLEK